MTIDERAPSPEAGYYIRLSQPFSIAFGSLGNEPLWTEARSRSDEVLADDLALVSAAFSDQIRILTETGSSRLTGPGGDVLTALWAKSFRHLTDATLLLSVASYGSAIVLVRAAYECVALIDYVGGAEGEVRKALLNKWAEKGLRPVEFRRTLDTRVPKSELKTAIEASFHKELYQLLSDFTHPNSPAVYMDIVRRDSKGFRVLLAKSEFEPTLAQIFSGWLLIVLSYQMSTLAKAFPHLKDNADWRRAANQVAEKGNAVLRKKGRPLIAPVEPLKDHKYVQLVVT